MALHFVTAAAEEDHVDSSDDARRNAGTVGSGNFVFGTGNKMAGSMTDPNTLRILDGDAMISGRHWNIDNYEEVVIENGTPGMNRWDLVVANAKTNPSEVLTLKVYKGVETEGEPVLPSYIDGDLNGTDTEAEQPLYAILHTGLSVGEPVAQFEVWMSESEFRDSISQLYEIVSVSTGSVAKNTASYNRVPTIDGYIAISAVFLGTFTNGSRWIISNPFEAADDHTTLVRMFNNNDVASAGTGSLIVQYVRRSTVGI